MCPKLRLLILGKCLPLINPLHVYSFIDLLTSSKMLLRKRWERACSRLLSWSVTEERRETTFPKSPASSGGNNGTPPFALCSHFSAKSPFQGLPSPVFKS